MGEEGDGRREALKSTGLLSVFLSIVLFHLSEDF
jgi:hypothetical protein